MAIVLSTYFLSRVSKGCLLLDGWMDDHRVMIPLLHLYTRHVCLSPCNEHVPLVFVMHRSQKSAISFMKLEAIFQFNNLSEKSHTKNVEPTKFFYLRCFKVDKKLVPEVIS